MTYIIRRIFMRPSLEKTRLKLNGNILPRHVPVAGVRLVFVVYRGRSWHGALSRPSNSEQWGVFIPRKSHQLITKLDKS